MPGIDLLIPFLIATLLFAYFPGPALLYTAAQTLARGRQAPGCSPRLASMSAATPM